MFCSIHVPKNVLISDNNNSNNYIVQSPADRVRGLETADGVVLIMMMCHSFVQGGAKKRVHHLIANILTFHDRIA